MAKKPKLALVTEDFISSADRNYIVLNEDTSAETKIGKEAIAKILPALMAADNDARMDFAISVDTGQPFETQGGKQLEKIIYGVCGRFEKEPFHQSVKDVVENCLVTEAGGMAFNPQIILHHLTQAEWAGMERSHASFRAIDNYAREQASFAAKPVIGNP